MKKITLVLFLAIFSCSKPIIDLKIITASSLKKQISKHKQKEVVMLNFWATHCAPCIEEFPDIMDLAELYEDKGLKIYFVSTDWIERKKSVVKFLEDQGVKGVSFLKKEGGDHEFITSISSDWSGALPFTIIFDKKGIVYDSWENKKNKAFFEARIREAISL